MNENSVIAAEDRRQDIYEKTDTELLNGIFTRGSIRKYRCGEIDEKALRTMIYAGMCAPSARNIRPYHIVVFTGKAKDLLAEGSRQPEMMKSAGLWGCGEKLRAEISYGGLCRGHRKHFACMSCTGIRSCLVRGD